MVYIDFDGWFGSDLGESDERDFEGIHRCRSVELSDGHGGM